MIDYAPMSAPNPFTTTLKRECRLAFRHRAQYLNPLLFFVVVVTLFPLAVGGEPALLRKLAPGVIWVAALLATLLSLPRLFSEDYHDGSLEQFLLYPQSLSLVVLGKLVGHWLTTGLPLLLLAPLLGAMLFLDGHTLGTLCLTLALGTPLLSLLGSVGTALTVGLRNQGILLSLLVIPLYIPVLIFAAGAVVRAQQGLDVVAPCALLGAILTVAIAFVPVTSAFALRIGLESS